MGFPSQQASLYSDEASMCLSFREARALLNQQLSEDLQAARNRDLEGHPGGGFFA